MGFIPNQTQSLDPAGPEKTRLEPTSQPSPLAADAIVALGVLTFALQLCVVLYFLLRCWRLDNRVQEALKQNTSYKNNLLAGTVLHQNLCSRIEPLQSESAASISAATSDSYEPYQPVKSHLFGRSIPWDLVQQ